jgi:hypothetical protein
MSWLGQASEHDADHSETYEGGSGSCIAFEVARYAAVSTDPGERAFDDPAHGKDDEAMQLLALDDFQCPGASVCDGCGGLGPLVASVGEDALDKGEGRRVRREPGAIAVLYIGGMDDDVQQEAERVDQGMPLAALGAMAAGVRILLSRPGYRSFRGVLT